MAYSYRDILNEPRRRSSYGIPDPITFSTKGMIDALESIGLPKRYALKQAREMAATHGLTPDELLFLWVRERGLLFTAGRFTVQARRRKS